MSIIEINQRIYSIYSRVGYLERINDEYAAKNGKMNTDIYNQIQQLMDERDELYIKKLDMGGI